MGSDSAELSLLFTDDPEIAELNQSYRDKDGPTDVLSFPMEDSPDERDEEHLLGDVVISIDTAERQAEELGVSLPEEILRLLIHGVLHLHGYEHVDVDEQEVRRMESKEDELFLALVQEVL